jgi:hypothetical protein
MMNLQITWSAYAQYLVPLKLRGPKMAAWITALVAPLQTVNNAFAAWAYGQRYTLSFNGQVMYLQHRLNDQFDSGQRRIYIDDPAGPQPVPLHVYRRTEQQNDLVVRRKSEGNPVYLENKLPLGAVDFVVFVPVGTFSPAIEVIMRAVIDRYRIAGVTYSFQTF